MSRRARIVLVCEDSQHEAFARRFLARKGWDRGSIRVEKLPGPRGSGEQFVRERFPTELRAIRSGHVDRSLVVMIDGDKDGLTRRLSQLADACRAVGVDPRAPDDRVAVLVPTWRIETWLAYLDGDAVDESRQDYPRLSRARDCRRHVDALVQMCEAGGLRAPAPPSLEAACREFNSFVRVAGQGA
jgi:hypothetical protein